MTLDKCDKDLVFHCAKEVWNSRDDDEAVWDAQYTIWVIEKNRRSLGNLSGIIYQRILEAREQ